MNSGSMYALKDVPGKGKGLIATQNIPKGTRILSEQAVITEPEPHWNKAKLKKHISLQVERLSDQQRESLLSMYNMYPYQTITEQCLGILQTNGLPIEDDGVAGGVFLEACRINHACDNNAQKNWNSAIKRHTIHALRDISEGEEITIYYLGSDGSRAVRQKRLQDKFGFLCSCRLCSLPTDQSEESDKRLARIKTLDDLIGRDGMQMKFSLRTLRYVDEEVRLYNEQGPGDAGLSRAYLDAAQVAIAKGDLARGRIFAERAVDAYRTAQGSDSKEVTRFSPLARNPGGLPLYGLSMEWKTSPNEVPVGLDADDFEDWLWRRETKPKSVAKSEHLAILRNREFFLAFSALPNSDKDAKFYEKVDGVWKPLREWCFLGEIVQSTKLHHLELELRDVDDQKIPVHFYTEGLGLDMSQRQIQKGYTVAVQYAKRYAFRYGDPGIRHEDPNDLKIFPMSLKRLLILNDQVQQFSTKIDELRTCHGCSKKASSLNRCGKCLLFWYCDSDCQKRGWKEGGHKNDCKLLKDPKLQDLFASSGATSKL